MYMLLRMLFKDGDMFTEFCCMSFLLCGAAPSASFRFHRPSSVSLCEDNQKRMSSQSMRTVH